MSTVQRVKYLWDASLTLNSSAVNRFSHVNNLLKSNLRNVCRKLAGTNTAIPLERFSESQMCKRCSLHWLENNFHIKYKAQNLQISTNKAKKLVNKFNEEQTGKRQGQLTRKQKKRAKWLLKRATNKLLMNCEFCQTKTSINLDEPDKWKGTKKVHTMKALKNVADTNIKPIKKINTKQQKSESQIFTQKANVKEVLPAKHNLNRKKTKKAKPKPKKNNKSQQKSSLLHLAALLKSSQDTSKSKNSLEAFLK